MVRSRDALMSRLIPVLFMLLPAMVVLLLNAVIIPLEKFEMMQVVMVRFAWFVVLIPAPVVFPRMVLLRQSISVFTPVTKRPDPAQVRLTPMRDGLVTEDPHEVSTI